MFYPLVQQEFVRQYRASGFPEQGSGAEEKEAWKGDWDDEKTPNERYESEVKTARERTQGPVKKTAREGTPAPLK